MDRSNSTIIIDIPQKNGQNSQKTNGNGGRNQAANGDGFTELVELKNTILRLIMRF